MLITVQPSPSWQLSLAHHSPTLSSLNSSYNSELRFDRRLYGTVKNNSNHSPNRKHAKSTLYYIYEVDNQIRMHAAMALNPNDRGGEGSHPHSWSENGDFSFIQLPVYITPVFIF